MRKILLATTLLSIAISENILVEKRPRPTMWIREKQFSSKRPKRASRDDILSELENVPNYDDRQFSRISEPRFINEPVQLPPVAVIRRPDLMRFSQVGLLPSDKSKLDNAKPTVLISIGIQDKSAAGGSQEACSTRKNYRKHNQNWQLQQPFYVDEPHWINIDPDSADGSARHPESGDPYIMSRGKKFRIKSPDKLEKTIEDYEEFLDYTSRSKKLSTKNRVRRSVEMTAEGFQGDGVDERRNQKEMRRYKLLPDLDGDHTSKIQMENLDGKSSKIDERPDDKNTEKEKKINSVYDVFVNGFETDNPRNSAKELPYDRLQNKFAKQNRANNTGFIKDERKIQREEVPNYIKSDDKTVKIGKRFFSHKNRLAIDMNKGGERVLENGIFVREHGKRGNRGINWINVDYEDNINKKKTAAFERTRLRDGYFDRIENFSTYDLFIPSRGKKPLGDSEDSDKKGTKLNRSSAGRWEDSSSVQRYIHREESESEEKEAKQDTSESEADKDDTRSTDAQLTTKSDSKSSSGMRSHANYREKRNIYETRPKLREDALLKSIEQIAKSAEAYWKPRDKHSILDLQNHLSTDPFFIMRGKKASHELTDTVKSLAGRQNDMDDVARAIHYSIEENLLKMLLTKKSKCNEQYCDIDMSRALKGKPTLRNRRDSLDKLLSKYDPFVIIRGKKMKLNNF